MKITDIDSKRMLIKVRGKTKAVPFVVSSRNKPVAKVALTSRWERRWR